VVVGPRADPAGIAGAHDVARALATLAESGATFVSRGDDSGTHIKELSLWRDAGLVPDGAWYNEAGQGMGGVITMASEMQAYTLADRGTWLAMSDQVDLAVIVEGDTRLFNPYGVIAVDPVTHPDTHYLEAMLFVAWLTSPEGRSSISEFTVNGQVLFHPAETAE
jgi:tungstate transport system substrate-binding protein